MRPLLSVIFSLLASAIAASAEPAPTHEDLYKSSKAFLDQADVPFEALRRKDVEPFLKERGVPKPGFAGGCFLRNQYRSTDLLEQLVFLQAIDGKKAVDTEVAKQLGELKVGDTLKLTIMELRDGKWVRDTMTLKIGKRAELVETILARKKDPVDGWERVSCTASVPPFELYSHKDKAGHRLMLKATYKGDDWIFAESLKVSIAGETFELKEGRPRDEDKEITRDGGVEEVLFYDLSERPDLVAALLKTFETAKSADNRFILRFQGKGKFADRELLPCLAGARTVAREYYVQRFAP